ncbi:MULTISPECIES: DUF305 domain-containing protein [unclassified Streptomyces]|uniref:DUF305 domain-containing protein n=1 Tax=unclassified Streptomyces TaxID=2593676 RepID=UPI000DD5F119|nr:MULTISPECIES: DUF305 domain-containing protein [unclassified Streptomyces]QZZ31550.1 DUF305 domain-containing protein [Streptomyces sp. ST1015]
MRSRRTSVVAAALVALALAGCDSGADDEPKAARSGGPTVLVPGLPGEANRTMSAEEAAGHRAQDDSPNTADVSYAQMMIVHHAQALEMTALAPGRAGSAAVKGLAERIAAAQKPEIEMMRDWLTSHGKPQRAQGHSGHAAMPGMATDAQLAALRGAKGAAFDKLFLTLMITHHEGAITMATDVKAQGNNIQAEEMADDVVAQQASEIARMRTMLQ